MRAPLHSALAATALALGLAAPAPPARAAAADAAILRLSDDYLEHWLPRHPARATALGARRFDEDLPVVTASSLAEDAAWTHALRARVDSIPETALGADRRADRALLLAACDRDLAELELLRPWRRDPASALPLVRDAITALADPARGVPCRRLAALARRLARVPEVLRAARIMLETPDSAAVAAAIPAFEETARLYRTTIGASVAECGDARQQARFAEADSAAVGALDGFVRALREELLPHAGHASPLGAEGTARWLAAQGVLDGTPAAMLERARSEAAAAESASAGGPRVTLADSATALEWMRDAIDAAMNERVARGRPLTVPLARLHPRVRVRRGRAHAGEATLPALDGPGSFEPAGRGWTLGLILAPPASLDERAARRALDLALVDLARAAAQRDLPSLLREAVPWSATAEGVRADLAFGTPRAEDAAAAAALLGTLLDGAAPGVAWVAPERAFAALGRWRMEALRAEVRAALGERADARAFDDAVLAAGDAPWPLVRAEVMARLAAPR